MSANDISEYVPPVNLHRVNTIYSYGAAERASVVPVPEAANE